MAIRTRAELNSIVATNLNTANNTISALEHRTVEKEVLDYSTSRIISRGDFYIGDVNPGIQYLWTIPLGISLLNSNYTIIGHFLSFAGSYSDDNDVFWSITDKTNLSFTIYVNEFTGDDQNVGFNWMAISSQDILLTTTI